MYCLPSPQFQAKPVTPFSLVSIKNNNSGSKKNSNECKVSPPRRNLEKIRDPTPEPIVKREVKRFSTPLGDVIERVIVRKLPQTIIEKVIEQPRKPAPRIVERIELEPAPPPITKNICVMVDPRSTQTSNRSSCLPSTKSPPLKKLGSSASSFSSKKFKKKQTWSSRLPTSPKPLSPISAYVFPQRRTSTLKKSSNSIQKHSDTLSIDQTHKCKPKLATFCSNTSCTRTPQTMAKF